MIIPVRCFTCNQPIGSQYLIYLEIVKKIESGELKDSDEIDTEITPSEYAFNLLKLQRYCCKRHLLSQTDLVDII